MNVKFIGSDFGPLVLGRTILRRFPKASLELEVCLSAEKSFQGDLCRNALLKILVQYTRFGRIGVFYDRKNISAKEFFQKISKETFDYAPHKVCRAESLPCFSFFETQILYEMANEGFSQSVEFRRLMRKVLRRAKNHHCDCVFFCETIFGEERTKKILQHLAGTQLQVFTPDDFLVFEDTKEGRKRSVKITTEDDIEFVHQRAEEILCTKLKKTDITH